MCFRPLNTSLGLSPRVPGHRPPGCQIIQNVHVLLEGEILNICGKDEVHGAQGVFVLSSQQIIIVTRKRTYRHSLSQGRTVIPCQSTPKRRSMTTVWKFFMHANTASIRNEHTNSRDMTTKKRCKRKRQRLSSLVFSLLCSLPPAFSSLLPLAPSALSSPPHAHPARSPNTLDPTAAHHSFSLIFFVLLVLLARPHGNLSTLLNSVSNSASQLTTTPRTSSSFCILPTVFLPSSLWFYSSSWLFIILAFS